MNQSVKRAGSTPRRGAPRIVLALALLGLGVPARAADAPGVAGDPRKSPDMLQPLLATPTAAMTAMADSLDKSADMVVATIGGQNITQGDAADVLRQMPVSLASLGFAEVYRRALDQLIQREVMALDAGKAGLDKDPTVLRRQHAAAQIVLADAWLNHEVEAKITDQALRERYLHTIAGRPGPEEVRARVILVPTQAEAMNLIAKLQAGGDFADLARQNSKDASASKGGDLGYVALDALSPEIGSVMFALAPGQATAYPVHAGAGYFILRVEGRRQRATPTFDESRDSLARAMRREAVNELIRGLASDIKPEGSGTSVQGRAIRP